MRYHPVRLVSADRLEEEEENCERGVSVSQCPSTMANNGTGTNSLGRF